MTNEPQFTVLVVDNEPSITKLLSRILQKSDLRVLVAQNGYQAITILAENSVDVVVTDVDLKSMTGLELLTHIQCTDDTINAIMMTNNDSYDLVRKALRANAYDHLEKPLNDHDDVINTVLRACESGRLKRENSALIASLQTSNTKLNAANKRLLQLNKQLRKLATTDSLTSLYNRRYIDDWIQNYAFSNTSLEACYSILLLDVDYFKDVNDKHGHDGGDKVLKHLASLLKNGNRSSDLIGRYGGEEFIIVMPGTDDLEALEAAEKVRTTIESASINVSSGSVQITVSIGVSTDLTAVSSPGHATMTPAEAFYSGRTLIAQADKALYTAKDLGRNCCVHYSQMSNVPLTMQKTG
ncbi:MAG: diguanylate cyclase [Granulosicoccus sp.]